MRTRPSSSSSGFTLIEMMVAISIAAVLLAIAVPSFINSRLSSQLRASANDLAASINFARSEAIKRGTSIRMCVSSDGSNCTGGNWNQGWIVYRLVGADIDVLERQDAAPSGFLIKQTGGTSTFVFQSTGVDTTAGTFTICRATPTAGNQERVVSVNAAGRASVERTTAGTCS